MVYLCANAITMAFGTMGMFHAFLCYLSDSSSWLIIMHLPLVMELQFLVEISVNAFLKFLLVNIAAITLLLISHPLLVRSTSIRLVARWQKEAMVQQSFYDTKRWLKPLDYLLFFLGCDFIFEMLVKVCGIEFI